MKNLEGKFQLMREELEYYETDYQTKMLHKIIAKKARDLASFPFYSYIRDFL